MQNNVYHLPVRLLIAMLIAGLSQRIITPLMTFVHRISGSPVLVGPEVQAKPLRCLSSSTSTSTSPKISSWSLFPGGQPVLLYRRRRKDLRALRQPSPWMPNSKDPNCKHNRRELQGPKELLIGRHTTKKPLRRLCQTEHCPKIHEKTGNRHCKYKHILASGITPGVDVFAERNAEQ